MFEVQDSGGNMMTIHIPGRAEEIERDQLVPRTSSFVDPTAAPVPSSMASLDDDAIASMMEEDNATFV